MRMWKWDLYSLNLVYNQNFGYFNRKKMLRRALLVIPIKNFSKHFSVVLIFYYS